MFLQLPPVLPSSIVHCSSYIVHRYVLARSSLFIVNCTLFITQPLRFCVIFGCTSASSKCIWLLRSVCAKIVHCSLFIVNCFSFDFLLCDYKNNVTNIYTTNYIYLFSNLFLIYFFFASWYVIFLLPPSRSKTPSSCIE